MTIKINHNYYFDEYKTFNEFLKEFMKIIKDKKIKSFISTSGLLWFENYEFTDKIYNTDEPNYLIFDDDTELIFNYNWFSMIDVKIANLNDLNNEELKNIKSKNNFNLDCYGSSIIDYELNKFGDEYIINPVTNETRPANGNYFKEIIFQLSNNKKLCICAENAEADGYCDIWMENNNLKGIFNGQNHKII